MEILKARQRASSKPRAVWAQAALTLYAAMHNCRDAFAYYKAEQTSALFANFVFAIDALMSVLQNLNPRVGLFAPALAAQLQRYPLTESRLSCIAAPQELARTQIRILRAVVGSEYAEMALPEHQHALGEFDDALADLRGFIEECFTLDDLFALADKKIGVSASAPAQPRL